MYMTERIGRAGTIGTLSLLILCQSGIAMAAARVPTGKEATGPHSAVRPTNPISLEGPPRLQQTSPSPANLPSWPFVTGVPLPRGLLSDVSQVRLVDAKGHPMPTQFEALAHWSPKREWVKWLRVAFSAPAAAGQLPEYSLEFGKAGAKLEVPITVTQDAGQVTVDTGEVAFSISKKAGGRLLSVRRGRTDVYRAAPADGAYVVDHTGAIFRASLDDRPKVTIEEAGPVRAVVRVESWYERDSKSGFAGKTPAGDRLNKCIMHYYAYAGQPSIELHWTFVITADTTVVRFGDVGLQLTGAGQARLGLDDGKSRELTDGYLIQKKHDLYVVRAKGREAYVDLAKGQKAPGWIANDTVAVTMRDFWQTFPNELEAVSVRSASVGPESKLILHAWPAHGEYNEDWFIEPTPEPGLGDDVGAIAGPNGVKLSRRYFYNVQYFHHGPLMDFAAPDWWYGPLLAGDPDATNERTWIEKEYEKVGWGGHWAWEIFNFSSYKQWGQKLPEYGTGTSRTLELLLDFSGDKPDRIAARRKMFLDRPHVWLKDPEWLNHSQVFGPLNVRAAEAWLDWSKEVWRRTFACGHYGKWIYGNMPQYFVLDHTPAPYRMLAGAPHYGYGATEWLLYMCTRLPKHLRLARANTRQYRDVEIVHWTSPQFEPLRWENRKILGGACCVAPYPWRMGCLFGFYSKCDYMLWDYYICGDRQSLETAAIHADGVVKHGSVRNLYRDAGGNYKTLLDWYAHSWDPAMAAKIDDGLRWIFASDPTAQKSKPGMLHWTRWMAQYLELTEDPTVPLHLRRELIEWVRKWLGNAPEGDYASTGYTNRPGSCLAAMWFATGDTKYLMPFVRSKIKARAPRDSWLVPEAPPDDRG